MDICVCVNRCVYGMCCVCFCVYVYVCVFFVCLCVCIVYLCVFVCVECGCMHQARGPRWGWCCPAPSHGGSEKLSPACVWAADLTTSSKCFLGGNERPLISSCTHNYPNC